VQKIDLTPELAAELLAKPYHRQRKPGRQKIRQYARIMEAGEWRDYVPPPIMVDKKTGTMFNGLQRCSAVVQSGVTIRALIDYEADGDVMFDVIDSGLIRQAHQFIEGTFSSARASAARVILWTENAFDQPLASVTPSWQNHEVLDTAARFADDFDTWVAVTDRIYVRTQLSRGAVLAALTIAGQTQPSATQEFAEGLSDPASLLPNDPAWRLFDRMNKTAHKGRRRKPQEDWTLFVRALNAHLNSEQLPTTLMTSISAWPRVGETERDLRRRISVAANRKSQRAKIEARIRRQVEAEISQEEPPAMAAAGS